jgi:hypothetical protein
MKKIKKKILVVNHEEKNLKRKPSSKPNNNLLNISIIFSIVFKPFLRLSPKIVSPLKIKFLFDIFIFPAI